MVPTMVPVDPSGLLQASIAQWLSSWPQGEPWREAGEVGQGDPGDTLDLDGVNPREDYDGLYIYNVYIIDM